MAISSAALNGTSSTAKYQSVYLEFWQISQSIAGNTTTFGYKAYIKSNVSGANGYTAYGHYEFTGATSIIKVTNQDWTWDYVRSDLIKDGTFTIPHAADGTLANQTLTVTAGGSAALGYATVSVTLPVATIPRATTPIVNATTKDMGQPIVITINGVATFSHKLYYTFPGKTKTSIATVAAETTSYTWTIPIATLAPLIPNATSGTVTIIAETLNGTEVIGTKTTTFTATIPASAIPTITKSATEAVAGLALQFGAFIQGKSKLSLTMASSPVYGSTITSQLITANGQTFSASNGTQFTQTTGFLNTVGANTITYKATDSRGRSATATLSVTVLAYTAPQITVFKVERVNGSGVADPTGTAVKATYAITVAPLGLNKNTKAYTLKHKTSTASTYTSIPLTATSYTPNTYIIPAVTFSTSYIYNFQLVATDYFGSTTVTGTVNSGFVPMHFRTGGKGVGIGMRSTKDALQVGLPTEFNSGAKLTGADFNQGIKGIIDGVYTHEHWGGLRTNASANTGAILISIGSQDTMFNMSVSIRSYNFLAEINMGGYTQTGTSAWHRGQASGIVSGIGGGTLNVRFLANGANRYIAIGDTNTVWGGYLFATIDKVRTGFGSTFANQFVVSLVTALPGTISSTISVGAPSAPTATSTTNVEETTATLQETMDIVFGV